MHQTSTMTAAAAARTCAAYVNGVAFTPNAPAISLFFFLWSPVQRHSICLGC
jgi:hypothetical protein